MEGQVPCRRQGCGGEQSTRFAVLEEAPPCPCGAGVALALAALLDGGRQLFGKGEGIDTQVAWTKGSNIKAKWSVRRNVPTELATCVVVQRGSSAEYGEGCARIERERGGEGEKLLLGVGAGRNYRTSPRCREK